MFQAYTIKRI